MRTLVFEWLGHEFVELIGESQAQGAPAEQTRELFERFNAELRGMGLSLDNTVRSRLWGRDRASRDEGSRERVAVLAGAARSASSSYISPSHFDSDASVALDLWAMRPATPGPKTLVEYDPPIVPLRYLVWERAVVLSGVTAVLATLADQVADILPRIEESLLLAGSGWEQVQRMSCFLHRSQLVDELRDLIARSVDAHFPSLEVGIVDGYSSEGKLVEIEVTAALGVGSP